MYSDYRKILGTIIVVFVVLAMVAPAVAVQAPAEESYQLSSCPELEAQFDELSRQYLAVSNEEQALTAEWAEGRRSIEYSDLAPFDKVAALAAYDAPYFEERNRLLAEAKEIVDTRSLVLDKLSKCRAGEAPDVPVPGPSTGDNSAELERLSAERDSLLAERDVKAAALETTNQTIANLDIAECVYGRDTCQAKALEDQGYVKVDEKFLDELGVDLHPKSGLHMEIYKKTNEETGKVEYILAMRGSIGRELTNLVRNPIQYFQDWVRSNTGQGLGLRSPQYDDAITTLATLTEYAHARGESVSCVGHSKSGGQCSAAAVVVSAMHADPNVPLGQQEPLVKAYVYDASGVHDNTLRRPFSGDGQAWQQELALSESFQQKAVHNIRSSEDELTHYQEEHWLMKGIMPDAIGTQETIPVIDGQTFESGHALETIREPLEAQRDAQATDLKALDNELREIDAQIAALRTDG